MMVVPFLWLQYELLVAQGRLVCGPRATGPRKCGGVLLAIGFAVGIFYSMPCSCPSRSTTLE